MLALVSQIPIAGQGGVEMLVRELVRGLSAHRTVHLMAPDSPEVIETLGLTRHLTGYLQVDRKRYDDVAADTWSTWLRQHSVDTLHFHFGGPYSWGSEGPDGGLLPRLHRRNFRILATNHQAVSPLSPSKRDIPIPRRIAAHLKRLPGKLRQLAATEKEFLVSRHDLRVSQNWYPFQKRKFGQIYHSLLDADTPAPPLPESRVILCLATICFRKGQHVLAEAFAQIADQYPDWKLRLTGMHSERECVEHIRQFIDQHGLTGRIELTGPSDAPWAEIANAEIYVQPSLLEGLGLSLQEAAFAARPCIGSNTGGIPELISRDESGILTPPGDAGALSRALEALIQSRDRRLQLGEKARSGIIAKGMTRQEMVSSYLDLYGRAARC